MLIKHKRTQSAVGRVIIIASACLIWLASEVIVDIIPLAAGIRLEIMRIMLERGNSN